MGTERIFSNKAELIYLSNSLIEVSQIVHKTLIEIGEEGAQFPEESDRNLRKKKFKNLRDFHLFIYFLEVEEDGMPEYIFFRAVHPFLFAIIQNSTILFIGRKVQ